MMKQIFILLITLIPILSFSQKEGKITFEEKTKMEIQLPEDSPISKEQLEQMMPSERKESYTLLFNEDASVYQAITNALNEEEANQIGEDGDAIQIKMIRATNENIMYHDVKNSQITQQQDFLGKTFLIKDKTKKYAWKLINESKEIAGYTCQKAIWEEEDRKVEAWFTTSISVASGPSGFYQLPGMILGLHVKGENNERWLTATKIELKPLEKNAIVAPQKGKVVTREKYEKVVEEKMKEMAEESGGGTIIRVGRQ